MRGTTTRKPAAPRHKWTKGTDGKYHCPVCDAEFDRPAGLGRHFAHNHKGEPTNGMAPAGLAPNQPPPPAHPGPNNNPPVGPSPDRLAGMMPPMTEETVRVRRACDAALSILMSEQWRGLTAAERWDVVGVLRVRLARETNVAASMLTGDMPDANMPPA